ncbi:MULTISPECIES: Trp biosynthesis-associated membrane protein [unclassified Agromyces]|uniref:Trp biosynthesis-associated membrane protein n=1 Tax=unclassified Agromyces TaxID=2639701 RepID=UPI0030150BF8
MRPERMKLPAILGLVAGSGLALLSWSQAWFTVSLVDGQATAGGATSIDVGGAVASPALAALALAGLALAGALAIAGPVIRFVLGLLAVVLGASVVLASTVSLGDPVRAVSPAVADATGVAGAESTEELVAAAATSAWPYAAVLGGVLIAAAGVVVVVTGRAWPISRRYGGGARLAPAAPGEGVPASDRAVDDWDGLSRGDDPTDEASGRAGEFPSADSADTADRPVGRDSEPDAGGGGDREPPGRTR